MRMNGLKWIFVVGALALTGCGACEVVEGSGHIEERELSASGFSKLDTCCGWRVIISQGEDEGIRLRGDDNIIDEIVTRESGSRLTLTYDGRSSTYRPTQQVRVEVTVADLESYTGSGGSDVTLNALEAADFKAVLSGGTSFEATNLTAESLDLDCSGGGNVEIVGGSFPMQDVMLSGGSSYDARQIETEVADFTLSGGSDATAWVTDTLDVQASGGSMMRYFGDPTVSESLSGGSTVDRRGAAP